MKEGGKAWNSGSLSLSFLFNRLHSPPQATTTMLPHKPRHDSPTQPHPTPLLWQTTRTPPPRGGAPEMFPAPGYSRVVHTVFSAELPSGGPSALMGEQWRPCPAERSGTPEGAANICSNRSFPALTGRGNSSPGRSDGCGGIHPHSLVRV